MHKSNSYMRPPSIRCHDVKHGDTQPNNTQHKHKNDSDEYYRESHNKAKYADCRYAECCGAIIFHSSHKLNQKSVGERTEKLRVSRRGKYPPLSFSALKLFDTRNSIWTSLGQFSFLSLSLSVCLSVCLSLSLSLSLLHTLSHSLFFLSF
jgi:hypothetical protein